MAQIRAWLAELGLPQYVEAFERNDVDFGVLAALSEEDLKELGVLSLGHRKKLLGAIQTLSAVPAVPAEIAPRASAAERRQLTVLFCDLVGSTALSNQLDPEELRKLMQSYQQACRDVIERYAGHIAQFLGDGIMAYFGWPRAHEDDAERSLRAGLEIVAAVKQVSAPAPLSVHIGIATGAVVVGEGTGEDATAPKLAVGETPNLAARLQALAAADEVVIAPSTHQLAGGAFYYADLGEKRLKGIVEPVRAWKVLGVSQAEGRFEATHAARLTPLVGREEELSLLLRRWEQAKEVEGQVVLLSGEPGIGKSRITQALLERIASEPHFRLRYQCSPYHTNSAFYPVIEQLHRAAGIASHDSPEEKLVKLEALLASSGSTYPNSVALLGALLGVPTAAKYSPLAFTPQKQKDETIRALEHQLLGLARQRPVFFQIEDAHWVDPSTLESLDGLVQVMQQSRVLVLITFRPDFQAKWTGQSHVTLLTLNRLGKRQTAELIRNVLGNNALPAEIQDQIAAKTDGVPLFVEELTKSVLESGLIRHGNDRDPLPALAIPTTLHDSLMARLDRLAPVKEVAQIGACIGREFDYALLSLVSPSQQGKLDEALRDLVASGLVFQHGTPPEAKFIFKHALVQDAAYGSLLKSTRVQLHAQIARAIEEHFAAKQDSEPELLAHHYGQAGLFEQAVQYRQKAGERAMTRSAYREAVAHLQKGLELLAMTTPSSQRSTTELSLQTALGWAYVPIRSWSAPEAHAAFARAHAVATELGDTPSILALMGLWGFHMVRGDQQTAMRLAQQTLPLVQRQADSALLIQATNALGGCLVVTGSLVQGVRHLREAVRLYDPNTHAGLAYMFGLHPKASALHWLGPALWLLGYPDQSLTTVEEAVALGRGLSNPFTEAACVDRLSWIHSFRREWDKAAFEAERTHEIAAQQGAPLYVAAATYWIGLSRVLGRGAAEGIEQMRRGMDGVKTLGTLINHPMMLGGLAEALGRVGRYDEALSALDQATRMVRKHGEQFWEAELYRVRGEILLALDPSAKKAGEEAFTQALDIARQQEAKMLELRAACSLARLWSELGRRTEARALLAPVYEWFTEGHETLDLRGAKALLEELGSGEHAAWPSGARS